MKRKLAAVFAVLLAVIISGSVYAAAPFFTAVNNTLLPFSESTSPFLYGSVLYVPANIFTEIGIFSSSSTELGRVHLYKGSQYVDFYENENKSVDQDGRERYGVSARRQNGIYFLPLGIVCSYFDLQYDIIPYDPISIIRIKSPDAVSSGRLLNDRTFTGMYKAQLQKYSNDYYSEEPPLPPPDTTQTPVQPSPPDPTYEDVTVYLSFYGLSAGYAGKILDSLGTPGYRCCFFVGADDIRDNPGLIRRIAGAGHSVGIWLSGGGYDEYLDTSRLLFEAAKLKTVLISSDTADEVMRENAEEYGLIFIDASRTYGSGVSVTADTVNDRFPTTPGAVYNLLLECNDNISSVLPKILSHLRSNDYTVVKIAETSAPN